MTRKFSLVAVVTALLVGGVMAMVVSGNIAWLSDIHEQTQALKDVRAAVLRDILFVMGVLLLYVINCILSFSKNLKLLFQNETDVLEKVSHGDLSGFVPVATSDEFGLIAGHTNTMIEGLRHRIRLLTALRLAEGLQKALLPDRAPEYRGIDLAGSCNYSELTGGDYYDFLQLPSGRPAVVVADACDHGVGAALLMTGARAFLLSAAERVDEPARIVKEINAFVSRDSEESASFLTLFLLEIDVDERLLRWVRAGHEPALLYDPERSRFEELVGEGIAVGVMPDAEFLHQERRGWSPGTVVVVGTDGIREAFNERGEMFGPERLRRVIAEHAHESAESIRDAVISRVHAFMGESAPEDDITLVVVKLA
jgi:sigma-B regulation protein RsbU (phosphoserine phosphatase)